MNENRRVRTVAAFVIATALFASGAAASKLRAANYFHVDLQAGDALDNIFERTVYRAQPRRISGFSTYVVRAVHGNRYDLQESWGYYGIAHGSNVGSVEIAPDGLYYINAGKRSLATDASGPFFNTWLWGTPPSSVVTGTTWMHRIPGPWEAGPSGMQTARVVSIDRVNGRVVLDRFGSGVGAPLRKHLNKVGGVQPYWGRSTWKGTTIVRRGLIESDELVVHGEIVVPRSATKPQHIERVIQQIEQARFPTIDRSHDSGGKQKVFNRRHRARAPCPSDDFRYALRCDAVSCHRRCTALV